MATWYVKCRKTGPVGVLIVDAASPEDAMSMVARSASAGEAFDIMITDTVNASGMTGVTGPSGSSTPAWVPANAVIHIDLVGGSPQGRAWVDGVGVVAVDTLLGSDPNAENGRGNAGEYDPARLSADGYRYSLESEELPPALIGDLRDTILAGATVSMQFKQSDGAAVMVNVELLSTDGNDGIDIIMDSGSGNNFINGTSWNGPLNALIGGMLNYITGGGAFNKIAFTLVSDRIDLAANGSATTGTFVLDEDDRPPANPFTAIILEPSDNYIQSITLYDPLPNTTGLSALSDTGMTNTAPHSLGWMWYDYDTTTGVGATFTEIDVVAGTNILTFNSVVDDEGNPLAWTLHEDNTPGDQLTMAADNLSHPISLRADGDGLLAGVYTFTVRATDPGGLYVEQEFTITVMA